ncbi:MAG: hypothetical protein II467_06815, partial [Bacilli bacterium]|nr:hypothetical protein [Bacilli bacterium]
SAKSLRNVCKEAQVAFSLFRISINPVAFSRNGGCDEGSVPAAREEHRGDDGEQREYGFHMVYEIF